MSEQHKHRNGHAVESDPTQGSTSRDPVEALAAEFARRYRAGDRVTVEEYASRHPAHANEIRDLFPTIMQMEQLNAKRLIDSSLPNNASAPKQLGDYRIIAEIARGGMGIVYEAEQVSLGRRVAVKVLPPHALQRERDIRRFEREAQTAANLHHSNIVPVFGVGEDNGQRYIVMQLIRGVGLDETLREIKAVVTDGSAYDETKVTTSRVSTAKRSAAELLESELKLNSTSVDFQDQTVEMPVEESTRPVRVLPRIAIHAAVGPEYFRNVARIGLQAAEALQYAHQNNTLHRDIKPGNLLLDEDGRVWIADFGLAKALQDDDVTCSGDIVGTMAYVAPERFRGTTTKASDIYSLGVTLHEMLTLQKAFDGDDRVAVMNQVTNERLPSPRKFNSAVPRDLETVVLKAGSHNPKDRYASAAKLASDLEAFLEGRPIEARRLSYLEHAVRWCGRNRGIAALAAAVVVLIGTVFGLLSYGYHHSDQQRETAEQISRDAIDALEKIFSRFALAPLDTSLGGEEADEDLDPHVPRMPISEDVAVLLEDLLEFYDKLSTQDEASDVVRVKYIAANRRIGDIHRRLGQLADARESYAAAIARIQQLNPALLDTSTMRLERARAQNGLGLTYLYSWSHVRDRVNAHRQAVEILDIADSTDEEKFELATSLYLLCGAERQHARHDRQSNDQGIPQELSHLDRARQILQKLKQRGPNRADYDLLLARCLLAQSSSEDALISNNQHQAIRILEGLIERFPDNPDYRFELGQVYTSFEFSRGGKCSSEQLAESEGRLRKGLAATVNLEIQHPNIPKYYLLKKHLHELLGRTLRKQKEYSEAESQYDRAIQMQQMLINRSENPEVHIPWLYELQTDYGRLLRDAGELDRAKALLTETVLRLEGLVERNDHGSASRRHKKNRRRLQRAYFTLSSVLDKLEDQEASDEMRQQAEDMGE